VETKGERREKARRRRRYGMKVVSRRVFLWDWIVGQRANKLKKKGGEKAEKN
jgi:hypothetical protein